MSSRMSASLFVLGSLFISPLCSIAAQAAAAPASKPGQSIAELIESDSRNGEWVFYRQRFLNSENQWAQYRGSIYAAVQNIKIDEKCRIELQSLVVDHFRGIEGRSGSRQEEDTTVYEISFTLTRLIAETMEVVKARPSQLRSTTHSVCDEKPSCELTWVRFKSPDRKISERISTNDQIEFSGETSTGVFSVSSLETGSTAIKQLQRLAKLNCP